MKPYLIDKNFDLERLKDSNGNYLFSSDNLALYAINANPSVPTNNGIGVLSDAISCKVTHELNGQYELEMQYPVDGAFFSEIQLRCLIIAQPDRTSGNQPFRIYEIEKPINGKTTIRARHLAYDLAGIVVKPFVASNIQEALSGLKTNAMTNCPFTFVSSRSTTAMFAPSVPTPIWNLMGGMSGSLLDVYGGEYTFDNYNVRLENRVGADNGVSVRYGVNMTDLEQNENCENCYTGVVAYWQMEDEVVYSPVIYAGGQYGYVKIMTVDMSERWQEKPTVERLKTAATSYITANQIGVPKVSWKVNFVPLDTTEEYRHLAMLERVSLGDTVTVKFERLGVDASARVRSIVWDVLLNRYVSVYLGSIKSNIADTIATQAKEISAMPNRGDVQSIAERISKTLTNAILGASGGSVRLLDTDNDGEPDTLYIADNPDPAQAVKVWRFNYQGWGASSNGYNGPFTMGATLDGGLMADFITAGVLNADLITAGTMSADRIRGGILSIGNYNNSNGTIDIYDSSGNFFAKVYTGGFWLDALDGHSVLHGKTGFSIRKTSNNQTVNLAKIYRVTDSNGNDVGEISLYSVDSNGTQTLNFSVRGDGYVNCGDVYSSGKIVCNELFVNGRMIT